MNYYNRQDFCFNLYNFNYFNLSLAILLHHCDIFTILKYFLHDYNIFAYYEEYDQLKIKFRYTNNNFTADPLVNLKQIRL